MKVFLKTFALLSLSFSSFIICYELDKLKGISIVVPTIRQHFMERVFESIKFDESIESKEDVVFCKQCWEKGKYITKQRN